MLGKLFFIYTNLQLWHFFWGGGGFHWPLITDFTNTFSWMKIKVLKIIMEVYDTKSSNVFLSVNYYKSLLLKSKKSKSFKYFSCQIFKKINISCHAFPKKNDLQCLIALNFQNFINLGMLNLTNITNPFHKFP